MKKSAWICVLLAAACAAPAPAPIEPVDESNFGEVGDAIVSPRNIWFPWAAQVYTWRGRCTGTLIAPRVLLIAAHCVPDVQAADGARARFPQLTPLDSTLAEVSVPIDEYFVFEDANGLVHTQFRNIDMSRYDVAVAILAHPITDIAAVQDYPSRGVDAPRARTPVYIVGADGAGRVEASALEDLEVFSDKYFRIRYGLDGVVSEPGDSGGPMIVNGTMRVIAVTSTGIFMGRIDPVACWIAQKVHAYGGEGYQPDLGRTPTFRDSCR